MNSGVSLSMKKVIAIIVLGLLFCNTSFARIDYGCGPLKFTETAVKHFHEYLTFKKRKTGEHESTEPDYPHWTVNHVNDYAVLFVVTDGLNSSGFGIYNFPGLRPQDYPNTMGIPHGAKVFAKKNRIYWCKIKKKISRKISLEELKSTLKELDFYDGE